MGVKVELPRPCVEDDCHSKCCTEPLVISPEFEKRFFRSPKEQVVDGLGIFKRNSTQLAGKSEYDVKVVSVEEALSAGSNPFLLLAPLASRAMTITAGVVGVLCVSALWTHLDMPAKCRSSTTTDVSQRLALGRGQAARLDVLISDAAQDLSHLELWSLDAATHLVFDVGSGVQNLPEHSPLFGIEHVEWAAHLSDVA